MKCYSCNSDADKLDGKTGRYYCGPCWSVILKTLKSFKPVPVEEETPEDG